MQSRSRKAWQRSERLIFFSCWNRACSLFFLVLCSPFSRSFIIPRFLNFPSQSERSITIGSLLLYALIDATLPNSKTDGNGRRGGEGREVGGKKTKRGGTRKEDRGERKRNSTQQTDFPASGELSPLTPPVLPCAHPRGAVYATGQWCLPAYCGEGLTSSSSLGPNT